MKRISLAIALLLCLYTITFCQDTCGLRISLLTCTPGDQLYSTWGHTAIRVTDRNTRDDYIFNYGTFEFGPDFNKKFIKGNLLYALSVETFQDFMEEYRQEGRGIQEQELLITCQEKNKLYDALQINATGNNRYYLYNFLYDNCTTRARDIIQRSVDNPVAFQLVIPGPAPGFRKLIHQYLDKENEYWSKLGIDILLGARVDKKPDNMQAMFLPDYLLKGMNGASSQNRKLVSNPVTILSAQGKIKRMPLLVQPFPVFSTLLVIILILSFSHSLVVANALMIFDFLFFLILGLTGILLLFMWFGTAHKECSHNYNLLWALPTHIVMAFFTRYKSIYVKKYFQVVFALSLLTLAAWFFMPQKMNNALLPVLLLILYRSWHILKKSYAGEHSNI